MRAPDARAAVREEYAELAARYEGRWARYIERTTARTLASLRPKPGEALVDVGCGTGPLLRAIVEQVPSARVVGIDLSAPMLEVARVNLPDGIQLVASDAGRIALASGSFDAVVSTSSFHYWPEPGSALAELRRLLRPGGRFILTDWCDDFVACRLFDRWLRLTRRAHYRLYGARECRALLERAGFRVERLERYKVSWLWGVMTLTACTPESDQESGT